MTLTPERIEEIRKRADAATAAPWASRPTATGMQRVLGWLNENSWRGSLEFVLASINSWSAPGSGPVKVEAAANADFIAHARTDIPHLIASHESLRLQLDEANARCVVDDEMVERFLVEWFKADDPYWRDEPLYKQDCFAALRAAIGNRSAE